MRIEPAPLENASKTDGGKLATPACRRTQAFGRVRQRSRKACLTLLWPLFCVVSASAEDIILRLRPEVGAPVITRITATEKVLLDAAPAGEGGEWQKLDLKVPFDGYVPVATLTKNFAIVQGTPVHFLPNANSETITRAKDGDLYEVKRVKDEWATVRFNKRMTTYFRTAALPSEAASPAARTESPAPEVVVPEPPALDLSISAPTHTPEPDAADFNPDLGIGHTSPEDLPPENVVWKSSPRAPALQTEAETEADPVPQTPPSLEHGIMVSPGQTQARESAEPNQPPQDQPLRLLVGELVREIETTNPAYPVRLRSEEGRLIAYVDFSGIFIEDLSPYLNRRVSLRGQVGPVRPGSRELVIFARDIQIAK